MIRCLPAALLVIATALFANASSAGAADAPNAPAANVPAISVLVKTMTPARGWLPRLVTAYGTTAPAPGAATTISVQYDGQVAELSVSAGQSVHAGDTLMRVVASAAALSSYDQARGALHLAQAELAHVGQLRGQQLATRDQVAQAEKSVQDAQTQVETLRRQGIDASAPPLRAPFDGVVSAVSVGQGDRIAANSALLTLVRAGQVVLVAGIEPADQPAVKAGDTARIITLSAGGAAFPGQVQAMAGEIDAKTRLVPIRIVRTDGQPLLGNQELRADITVGKAEGWKLPRSAVLTDTKGAYIFQIDGDKAVRVDIQVLVDAGDTMLVDGAIQPDRGLVTDGAYQLSDGMAVRQQDAAK